MNSPRDRSTWAKWRLPGLLNWRWGSLSSVAFTIAGGGDVNGDPKLLRVVLENLLGNAWKYTGKREDAVIEFGVVEFPRFNPPHHFPRRRVTGEWWRYAHR